MVHPCQICICQFGCTDSARCFFLKPKPPALTIYLKQHVFFTSISICRNAWRSISLPVYVLCVGARGGRGWLYNFHRFWPWITCKSLSLWCLQFLRTKLQLTKSKILTSRSKHSLFRVLFFGAVCFEGYFDVSEHIEIKASKQWQFWELFLEGSKQLLNNATCCEAETDKIARSDALLKCWWLTCFASAGIAIRNASLHMLWCQGLNCPFTLMLSLKKHCLKFFHPIFQMHLIFCLFTIKIKILSVLMFFYQSLTVLFLKIFH